MSLTMMFMWLKRRSHSAVLDGITWVQFTRGCKSAGILRPPASTLSRNAFQSKKVKGVGDASPLSKKVGGRRPPASPPHYTTSLPARGRSIVIRVSRCLYVCPLSHPKNCTSEFYRIFFACYLWLRLSHVFGRQ